MTMFKKAIMATACASLLLGTAGCVTDPTTGQQSMTRGGKGAVAGAAGGALLGGLIGGNATGALVGGAIGMLAGFCGTLMTPMAANFNLVPAALLELDDRHAVIKAQIPTALALLAFNIALMAAVVYRG